MRKLALGLIVTGTLFILWPNRVLFAQDSSEASDLDEVSGNEIDKDKLYQEYLQQKKSGIDKEEQYQEYLKKKAKAQERGTAKYETPEIYGKPETVVELKKGGEIVVPSPVASGSPGIPKAGGDLEPFGYKMFNVTPTSFAPVTPTSVPPDYTLGPGDNVIVNLWGKVDLQLNLTVDREGKIFIPKAGDLTVVGLTLDQFEKKLKEKLSTIYSGFRMSVMMGRIRLIKVFVFGEVTNPGGYAISSLSTLFNALYEAGGPNQRGTLRNIKLIRNNQEIATIDIYDFLLKGYNKDDMKLASNDVIYVPMVGTLVKMRGEVKRPAIYELKGGERVLDLIELAGGLKTTAYLERVMVDRIVGQDQRMLLDVNLLDQPKLEENNIELKDGDDVSVFSIFDLIENFVWIDGKVKHSGAFERNPGMRVWDLIGGGEQFQKDAYLLRADLIRTYEDGRKEIFPINLEKVLKGDTTENIILEDKDKLVVCGYWDVNRKKYVTIDGVVKKPGQYELYENIKLSDLIFLAGNPLKNAYLLRAEIAHLVPGKPADINYVNLEDLYTDSENFIIKPDQNVDVPLREDDKVFIREIPEWSLQKIVTLEGEVMFPGNYALQQEKESLYHLLQRAGGLTLKAFPKGVVFVRPSIIADVQRKNVQDVVVGSQVLERDTIGNILPPVVTPFNPGRLNRVIIDLPKILKEQGGKNDIVLAEGDQIYIPRIPSEVQVVGSVGASSSIRYIQGRPIKYYIDRAGGYTRNSDKGQTRLISADGRVISGGSLRGRGVELGDVIVVPQKIEKDRDWMKFMANTVAVLSGAATTIFVIDRLK
jgi:protein involved in polysaccharide export with SLBB domain